MNDLDAPGAILHDTLTRFGFGRFRNCARSSVFILAVLAAACAPDGSDTGADGEPQASQATGDPSVDPTADPSLDPAVQTGPTGVERLPAVQLPQGARYNVVLGKATDYIDEHPDISTASFDGIETVRIKPKLGKKLGYKPGRILLSRNGFMARKIVAVTEKDGEVRYKTVPATLAETFETVDIEAEVNMADIESGAQKFGLFEAPATVTWLNVASSKTGTKSWNFNQDIHSGSSVDVRLNGGIDLDYTFYLKVYVASGAANEFRSWIRFEADSDMEAIISANREVSTGEKEKSFASWRTAWSIGILSGIIDFDLVLNYEAIASGRVTAKAGMGFDDLGFKVGAEWKSGTWTKIGERSTPTWHKSFDIDTKTTAEIYVQPAVEAAILIYGLAGPELAIGPKLMGKFRHEGGGSNRMCGELDLALKAEANLVVDILGFFEIAEKTFKEWNIYTWNDVVTQCISI